MPVHTNTLTDVFKDFATCINATELKCGEYSLGTYAKARIVLSRLYYACFHKGLEDFPRLRNSPQGKKHKDLIEALRNSTEVKHQELLPVIEILKDLRVWADYDHSNTFFQRSTITSLEYYIYQVEEVL